MGDKLLSRAEKAYILDMIANSSYYIEEFGDFDDQTEKKLITSIFLKLQQ